MCKGQMSRMKTLFKLFCLSNEALAWLQWKPPDTTSE